MTTNKDWEAARVEQMLALVDYYIEIAQRVQKEVHPDNFDTVYGAIIHRLAQGDDARSVPMSSVLRDHYFGG